MAECEPVCDMCCVCQEEYSPPLSNHDLLRPDSCPSHWCHRECLMQWLDHCIDNDGEGPPRCPACKRGCEGVVDQAGASQVVCSAPTPTVTDIHTELDQFVGQYTPTEPGQNVDELYTSLIADFFQHFQTVSENCQLCSQYIDQTMERLIPCHHIFHHRCLTRVSRMRNACQCPLRHCRQPIVAVRDIERNAIVRYSPSLIVDPVFTDLQVELGLACGPSTAPQPCALCGEVGPGLPRVQPACCPGSHIVHESCLDRHAGTNLVRECPVDNCGRIFNALTRLPPAQLSNEEAQSASQAQTDGRCRICNSDVVSGGGVRPNNCKHLFHRECLVRETKSRKWCPVKGSKRKFRSIQSY